MTVEFALLFLLVGILSGITGGLLGIGGGVIVVPSLLFIFPFLDFPQDHVMQIAIGTSLACTTINAFAAAYFHGKHKKIDWIMIRKIILGIVIGSVLGSFLAINSPDILLRLLFGIFLLVMSLQFIFYKQPIEKQIPIHPSTLIVSGWGGLFSTLANLLGIGGGVFMISLFSFYRLDPKKIIGTSSCVSFCISLLGALLFLYKSTISHTNYIYLPAFLIIGVTGTISAFYGVKLPQALPSSVIRKIFSIFMILLGLYMVAQSC